MLSNGSFIRFFRRKHAAISRARNRPRRPKIVRIATAFALQVGAVVVLLFKGPLIVHTTLGEMLMFAPDAGYLFVLNGVIGVVWACVRTALSLLRSR